MNQNQGYAFIEFVKPESVTDCVNLFNELKLWDIPIFVYPYTKEAEYLKKYQISITGFNKSNYFDVIELKQIFSRFANIIYISVRDYTSKDLIIYNRVDNINEDEFIVDVSLMNEDECEIIKNQFDEKQIFKQKVQIAVLETELPPTDINDSQINEVNFALIDDDRKNEEIYEDGELPNLSIYNLFVICILESEKIKKQIIYFPKEQIFKKKQKKSDDNDNDKISLYINITKGKL